MKHFQNNRIATIHYINQHIQKYNYKQITLAIIRPKLSWPLLELSLYLKDLFIPLCFQQTCKDNKHSRSMRLSKLSSNNIYRWIHVWGVKCSSHSQFDCHSCPKTLSQLLYSCQLLLTPRDCIVPRTKIVGNLDNSTLIPRL